MSRRITAQRHSVALARDVLACRHEWSRPFWLDSNLVGCRHCGAFTTKEPTR